MAREVLVENNNLTRQGIISFDDQVYFPTILGGKWAKFPFVAVDEAQDMSPLNHRMLELSLRDDGRLMAVGDKKQAIYAFRGASTDSMDRIAALRSRWTTLPLTMTFRCPKVVVARQQGHAPGFRAAPKNHEGVFHRFERTEAVLEPDQGWDYKKLTELKPNSMAEIAILCRNNGPLLAMAFKLLRAGIGVYMLGRDIGKSLIRLSSEICKDDNSPADIVAGLIDDWKTKEVSLALANQKEERVSGIYDRAECLQAVLQNTEVRDAGGLRAMLKKLFDKDSGQVILGSIHRAKGLEWDLVVHLDHWRVPSKFAKQAAQAGDRRQLEQEHNLRYVCETRAKHTLVEASLEDYNG
jgi:DNA helicase-2/ATP-dependent DNA helicase PcrA